MYTCFHTDPRSLIPLPTGDYDAHYAHLNYIIHLIRLGCESRDVNCNMVDLPSSIPDKKEGEYVYIFSPPEDNSKFLTQDMHVSDTTGAKATTSLKQSSSSTRSTNRQFPRGMGLIRMDQGAIVTALPTNFSHVHSRWLPWVFFTSSWPSY